MLFGTEADQYEQFRRDGRYPAWLSRLKDRVIARVKTALERLEDADPDAMILGYHGLTWSEIEQELSTVLWQIAVQYEHGVAPSQVAANQKTSAQPEQPKLKAALKESLADQIKRLQEECGITAEEMAEALEVVPRSIYKHLAGTTVPRRVHIAAYEKLFSERLKRSVTLQKVSKRALKSQ